MRFLALFIHKILFCFLPFLTSFLTSFFIVFILLLATSIPLFGQFSDENIPKNLLDNDAKYIFETIQKTEKNTIKQTRILATLMDSYYNFTEVEKSTKKAEELANYAEKYYYNTDLGIIAFTILGEKYIVNKNIPANTITNFKARCTVLYEKLHKNNDCHATDYMIILARFSFDNIITYKKILERAYKEAKERKCPFATIEVLINKANLLYVYHYDAYGAVAARIEAVHIMDSLAVSNKKLFDEQHFSELYMGLANIHYKVGNYDDAIKYWQKADKLLSNDNRRQKIQITNNIGLSYEKKEEYNTSIKYFENALQFAQNQKDSVWIGLATGNIGDVLILQKKYQKAISYLETDVYYSLKFNELDNACISLVNMSECYLELKNSKKTFDYLTQATNIIQENEHFIRFRNTDNILSTKLKLYKGWLNYHIKVSNQPVIEAYYFKLNSLRDSVSALQKGEKLSVLQKTYDLEYTNSQKRIKELEDENITTKNIFIVSSVVLFFLLGLFWLRNYQIKVKFKIAQNKQKMVELVAESTINKQKIDYLETIEAQNREITASIEYAKIIQQSILPSNKQVNEILGNEQFFTIYQPKDIISGDFYLLKQKADKIIIILADCTGHGVPGAMMSMLANELLHKEISQNTHLEPNILLQNIYVQLKKRLNMKETKRYDGMDIAMIIFDKTTKILDFASVGSVSGCYVKNNIIKEFPRNKIYVPMLLLENHPFPAFQEFSMELDKTTRFYVFSDGIIDQFDSISTKKFGKKRLLIVLQDIQKMQLNKQKNYIETVIKNWKKDAPQTDDISLLVFEIAV